jgi:hypothetical protein
MVSLPRRTVLSTRPTETPRGDNVADIRDTQLVADFVRRLRRVALHPLALDEQGDNDQSPALPGDLLRRLMQVPTSVEEHEDGTLTVRSLLPDEVQFESLATRLRPFTLERDRLHWRKALGALDRLTGLQDPALRASSSDLHEEWNQATDRSSRARAFYAGYQVGDGGDRTQHLTDIDLAYAWLYQDVAHGDEVSTGYFDVNERYRAAVGVFSHLAVVAMETLHYINCLVQLRVITLPVGTFSDPVVVTEGDRVFHGLGLLVATEVGNDLSDPAIAASVPEALRPAFVLAQQMMAERREDPQPEVVTMAVRRASGSEQLT